MLDLELISCGSRGTNTRLEDTIMVMLSNMNSLEKVRIAIWEEDRWRNKAYLVGTVIECLKPLARLSLKEVTMVIEDKTLESFAQERWKSMQDSIDKEKEKEKGDAATSQSQ